MSRKKTTPRPRAAKAKAPPLTEAETRILKAIDVTRMLCEHKGAGLLTVLDELGRRNRDKAFAILLVHLTAAYKALYRAQNAKRPGRGRS